MSTPIPLPHTYPELVYDNDLDPSGVETSSDLQSLVQDVYHLFLEDLGANPDDPNRGLNAAKLLSGTQYDLTKLKGNAPSQITADGRVQAATVNISQNAQGGYVVQIQMQVDGKVLGLTLGYASQTGLIISSVSGM